MISVEEQRGIGDMLGDKIYKADCGQPGYKKIHCGPLCSPTEVNSSFFTDSNGNWFEPIVGSGEPAEESSNTILWLGKDDNHNSAKHLNTGLTLNLCLNPFNKNVDLTSRDLKYRLKVKQVLMCFAEWQTAILAAPFCWIWGEHGYQGIQKGRGCSNWGRRCSRPEHGTERTFGILAVDKTGVTFWFQPCGRFMSCSCEIWSKLREITWNELVLRNVLHPGLCPCWIGKVALPGLGWD